MREFRPYLRHLNALIKKTTLSSDPEGLARSINDALDGQPSHELRRLVPLETLQASGAFFTGSKLSRIALKSFAKTIDRRSIILDPACGSGDLLIACTEFLPQESDLVGTLKAWGKQMVGRDLYSEFIHAAKARLMLTTIRASLPHGSGALPQVLNLFPYLLVQSGLEDHDAIMAATHIVLNPPYTLVKAPEDCRWASGKVNAAALFLEACIVHARPGTRIVAILPDVLRSGSRYEKWRKFIEARSLERRLELYGQFDRWADVDVFILELEVRQKPSHSRKLRWNYPVQSGKERIADRFDVCVGPVVDYRDPHRGPWYPFITSRNLPTWRTITDVSRHRRFRGRTFSSPFVVIRRTSRRGDRHRAIGTIVNIAKPVAVENHLLVLRPQDGTIKTCKKLLSILENPGTTRWLDQHIRCRHLTVSSVSQVPWWSSTE